MTESAPASQNVTVTVSILDRDYQVSCTPAEREALERAARHLDEQMRSIRASGKIIGLERIAVMAALNMAHETLSGSSELEVVRDATQKEIDRLSERVTEALSELRQLKIS